MITNKVFSGENMNIYEFIDELSQLLDIEIKIDSTLNDPPLINVHHNENITVELNYGDNIINIIDIPLINK